MHVSQLFLTCSQNTANLQSNDATALQKLALVPKFAEQSSDVTALRLLANVTLFAELLCE